MNAQVEKIDIMRNGKSRQTVIRINTNPNQKGEEKMEVQKNGKPIETPTAETKPEPLNRPKKPLLKPLKSPLSPLNRLPHRLPLPRRKKPKKN